jgi:RNA polymerase sigma-70 factor, ECF subfamily
MIYIFTNEITEGWYEGVWQSLYEDNYDRVFKTALKIVIDKGHAEDVAQEAFVNAFLKIKTLKDNSKFSAWVCSIAKNIAKNVLKQKVNRDNRIVSFETMDTKIPDELIQLSEMDNPEILYEENEAAREILNYIEGLDSEGRHILHLKFYEELTYAKIAEQMNMKESTIRMKALRARGKVYKKINRYVDKEGLDSKNG